MSTKRKKLVRDWELTWSHKPTANSIAEEGYELSSDRKKTKKWLRQDLDVMLAVGLQYVFLPATNSLH